MIDKLIEENVINIPILGRCKDFAHDRNSVSHRPKTKEEARKTQKKLKENFIIGTRILQDIPAKILEKGYKLKIN